MVVEEGAALQDAEGGHGEQVAGLPRRLRRRRPRAGRDREGARREQNKKTTNKLA